MFEGFKVIFVEDDEPVRTSLVQTLELAGLQVQAFASAEEALPHVQAGLQGIVISDVRLQGMDGVALLKAVVQRDAEIPVILVTAHGDVTMAVSAMRDGAYDFIEKPFAPERFIDTAVRAMEKRVLRLAVNNLRQQLHEKAGMEAVLLGNSSVMQHVRAQILRLAQTSADVMVMGETGSGKELVARCLHDHSPRRDRHFVAINCGGLPDSLLESELFGHEMGAFTTANKRRIGKIEHAHGGTLLLDEIESMPLTFQVKLLRVLQERRINRLGSNDEVPVDVRVIAATKSDLLAMSQAQQFRSDLYYRLNVAVLTLPPLRERKEDLPLLFERFVAQAAQRYGLPAPTVDPAQMAAWMAHDWPGNVREARNAADRFVLQLPVAGRESGADTISQGGRLAEQMDALEKSLIEKALKDHQGSPTAVIAALGIGKKTLYEKLRRHGITINEFR
ncbi:MAG: sigma-54-dependent Fis family transcriptional regulator [Rhizobacter sp.]